MQNNTPIPPRRPVNRQPQQQQQRQRPTNLSPEQYAQHLRAETLRRKKAQEKRRRMYMRRRIAFGIFCVLIIVLLFFLIKFIAGKISNIDNSGSQSISVSQNSTSQAQPNTSTPENSTPNSDPAVVPSAPESEPENVPEVPVDETGFAITKLANANNPLPTGYVPEVVKVNQAGHEVDVRAADAIKKMIKDGNATGLELMICSAYRSTERQTKLFNDMKADYISKGMTEQEAYDKTKTIRAVPGTSEHETGLAMDIVSVKYQTLDANFDKTPEFKWLSDNAAEYGFILRYPREKGAITGIIYEPWHYRYVGVETAKEIKKQGLCLEEYAALQTS